ncbi:MAG: hypothetical protein PHC61_01085 [Chitinivibrionales bacterium]|nr:hypothetical protein [Chitinivibrionales bacterium]
MKKRFAVLFVIGIIGSAFPDGPSKLTVTFFGSSTCGECMEIKETMLKPLAATHADSLKVNFKDIENPKDFAMLSVMEKDYHVTSPSPQELFLPDTVLLGYETIMKNGRALIERYLADPDKWHWRHAYGDSTLDTLKTANLIKNRMKTLSFVGLFAIGFVDGVNPCAIATMIFLISFLGTQNRKRSDVLKIGLAFAGTVFLTYFLLGLGAFRILSMMDKFYWFSLAIRVVAVGIAVWVALLSIWDAVHFYRTKNTSEMKMQLPKGIKLLIHSVIRDNLSSNRIVIGAVITGFIVTLLEGACTAKIYLPTIMAMTHTFGFRLVGWLLLVFYNFLFVLPLLIVLTATAYGLQWGRLSKFQQKHMVLTKLLLALVLFGLAAFISVGR